MNIKKLNRIVGYTVFIFAIIKMIFLVLVMAKMVSILGGIYNGNNVESVDSYTNFSVIIGITQIILCIACLVVAIINIKYQRNGIIDYFKVLAGYLIELITPSFLTLYIAFAVSIVYMNAGNKIIKRNTESGNVFI